MALVGPNKFAPITASCHKQACVSHSPIEGEIVAGMDPLRVLVESASGVTMVFAIASDFDVVRDGSLVKGVDYVSESELRMPTTTVRCKVLLAPALEAGEDAPIVLKQSSFAETLVGGRTRLVRAGLRSRDRHGQRRCGS